jgi:hypothetical protein
MQCEYLHFGLWESVGSVGRTSGLPSAELEEALDCPQEIGYTHAWMTDRDRKALDSMIQVLRLRTPSGAVMEDAEREATRGARIS